MREQILPGGLHIRDDHLHTLLRAGRHLGDPRPHDHGAGRSGRGELHEPQYVTDLIVVVRVEPNLFHIERLGTVDIGHRYGHELDLPVHAWQRTPGVGRSSGPVGGSGHDVGRDFETQDPRGGGSLAASRNGLLFSANARASPAERHTSITRAPFPSIPEIWLRRPSGGGVSPPAPLMACAKPSRSKVSSHSNSTIVQNGMMPPRGPDEYLARAYGLPCRREPARFPLRGRRRRPASRRRIRT